MRRKTKEQLDIEKKRSEIGQEITFLGWDSRGFTFPLLFVDSLEVSLSGDCLWRSVCIVEIFD